MYRKIADFQKDWAYEAEATVKLLNNLTDESLAQKVTEDGRTLGFLAWHLVITLGEMPKKAGLNVAAPAEDAPPPADAREIAAAFESAARSVAQQVVENWTDETLEIEDNLYGETWKRGLTLLYLMMHQAHHRGQITVLMRQAGLPVTGIYGPAKEEWQLMGMPAVA